MAFRHKPGGTAGLIPADVNAAFAEILSFEKPEVSREVLRDWLRQAIDVCESVATDFHARRVEIGDADEIAAKHAHAVFHLSLDLLDVSDRAWPQIQDSSSDDSIAAFTNGVRLGVIYRTLTELAHGRHEAVWRRDDALAKGRQRTSAGAAEKKQRALDALAKMQKDCPDRGLTVQKEKAARELGISRKTLDRWLRGSQPT